MDIVYTENSAHDRQFILQLLKKAFIFSHIYLYKRNINKVPSLHLLGKRGGGGTKKTVFLWLSSSSVPVEEI